MCTLLSAGGVASAIPTITQTAIGSRTAGPAPFQATLSEKRIRNASTVMAARTLTARTALPGGIERNSGQRDGEE
jgi:hypothetical protein